MDSSTNHVIDPAFVGMSFADVFALAQRQQAQIKHISALNAKMAHELAVLKRLKFAAASERFEPEQKSLPEEAIDEDLQALDQEIGKLKLPASESDEKKAPKRQALPANLPRRDIHHEPQSSTCTTPGCGCQMKRIGEDVAE